MIVKKTSVEQRKVLRISVPRKLQDLKFLRKMQGYKVVPELFWKKKFPITALIFLFFPRKNAFLALKQSNLLFLKSFAVERQNLQNPKEFCFQNFWHC